MDSQAKRWGVQVGRVAEHPCKSGILINGPIFGHGKSSLFSNVLAHIHILFDPALLAEGGLPADPAAYVKRLHALLD